MNSDQLKKLQAKWYAKLEKAGFKDIEQDDDNLKQWHSHRFLVSNNYSKDKFDDKENYFRLAGQFLHEHKFQSVLDKKIWEAHSEGLSVREIVKTLKQKNIKVYKNLVHVTITRLAAIMGKNGK